LAADRPLRFFDADSAAVSIHRAPVTYSRAAARRETFDMKRDDIGALSSLDAGQGPVSYYRLRALEREGLAGDLDRLPFSIKVLLESVLRNLAGELVTEPDVRRLAAWNAARPAEVELPFMPARVILQDFTGVPAVVDLASMRGAVKRLGGDARRINPLVPAVRVVDPSGRGVVLAPG